MRILMITDRMLKEWIIKNPVLDTTCTNSDLRDWNRTSLFTAQEWRTYVRIHTNVHDNEKRYGNKSDQDTWHFCFGAIVHVPVIHNYISIQQIFIADPRQKQEKFKPNIRAEEHLVGFVQKEPEKEKKWNRIHGVVDPKWFSPDPDPALKLGKYGKISVT